MSQSRNSGLLGRCETKTLSPGPHELSLRACGARIVSRTDELREEDVGLGAGLFEVKKIGDEYFTFVTECKDPKACTILLRGASKEILAVSGRHLPAVICETINPHNVSALSH